MKDESFRLTPLDVRRTEFGTAMRGYDKASVDAFRERVADELEDLTRRNQELEGKARGFHEQLRAFREREKALNDALVSAQQLRAEMREQAEREGHLIIREARADGERLVDEMRMEQRRLAGDLEALDRARRAYVSQLRNLVERQLAELDAMAAVPPPAVILAGAPQGEGGVSSPPTPSIASASAATTGTAPAQQTPPSTPRSTRGASETPAWLNSVAKE